MYINYHRLVHIYVDSLYNNLSTQMYLKPVTFSPLMIPTSILFVFPAT